MEIINIAGYKFIPLDGLEALRFDLLQECSAHQLKGTILLSEEGINLNLAGVEKSITEIKAYLHANPRFNDMTYRSSFSQEQPFRFMRVKIRKEIITMGRPEVRAEVQRAPSISPHEFKQWLDEKRDITVLDTRNDYEVRFGSFEQAKHFQLKDFGDFPEHAEQLNKDKPVVMFCTGGIRCEKAALHLLNAGFPEVYQLDGGILNYFAEVGGAHYSGECFVFDQRIAVDPNLQVQGTIQCLVCNGPVTKTQQMLPQYVPDVSCPACCLP